MDTYKFIGRNLEITDAMRSYAEDKLDKLDRFFENIVDTKVIMSYNHNSGGGTPARVEVQLNVPHGIVRAEENGVDTYAAVDLVVDKLERQLKRFKGRYIAKRQESTPELLPQEEAEETGPEIVRIKNHVLRPMSPEDAAMQMDALGHDFYMFRNSETESINVIYLRYDGNYGLIEPAN